MVYIDVNFAFESTLQLHGFRGPFAHNREPRVRTRNGSQTVTRNPALIRYPAYARTEAASHEPGV